jgi:hypothetical protein
MKRRLLVIAASILAATGITLGLSVTAGSDPASIQFNDATQQVTLNVPDPACRPDVGPNACQWQLILTEPFVPGNPVVGTGSSGVPGGTVVLDYPSDFCGWLQADAQVGLGLDGKFHQEHGGRQEIDTCHTPPTTPTTEQPPPPTTPTTVCPPSGRPASANCPVTPPASVPPITTKPPASSPPVTPPALAPPVSTTPTTAANPNQLPNIAPAQNGVTTGNG